MFSDNARFERLEKRVESLERETGFGITDSFDVKGEYIYASQSNHVVTINELVEALCRFVGLRYIRAKTPEFRKVIK